jgi:phage protein D
MERDRPFYTVRVRPPGKHTTSVDVTDEVLSLTYDDEEKKADKVELTLDNFDLRHFDNPAWRKGQFVEVTFGYAGNVAEPRECVIMKVSGGLQLKIEAQAKSVLMNRQTKFRTFDQMKRSDVVKRIAAENGYGHAEQFIEDSQHVHPHVTQGKMTDAQFLKKLAIREGFEFYVDHSGFHWHKRDLKQQPVRTLTWYVDQGAGDFLDFDFDNDHTGKHGAHRVKGIDPLSKKKIDHRADNTNVTEPGLAPVREIVIARTAQTRFEQQLEADIRHTTETTSQAHAKSQADGHFRKTQGTTIRLDAKIVGDPRIMSKRIVEVAGIGKRFSGKYFIVSASHTLDANGGYVTSFKAHRDGHGGYGGQPNIKSNAALNKKNAAKDTDKNLIEVEVVDSRTAQTHREWRDLNSVTK